MGTRGFMRISTANCLDVRRLSFRRSTRLNQISRLAHPCFASMGTWFTVARRGATREHLAGRLCRYPVSNGSAPVLSLHSSGAGAGCSRQSIDCHVDA